MHWPWPARCLRQLLSWSAQPWWVITPVHALCRFMPGHDCQQCGCSMCVVHEMTALLVCIAAVYGLADSSIG